ncbi:FHA domain-containing protein [Treponema zioleckii]|uniref:FHA domain-containing protein n=1 Tax=Treponema zioleckii TaxID=331680 RepID=UPI00168BEC9D|nr:FHA domain-containing protein [Treponema zioleckii]
MTRLKFYKKENKKSLIAFVKEFVPYDNVALALLLKLINEGILEQFCFYKETVTEDFLNTVAKSQRKIRKKISSSTEVQDLIFWRISDFFEENLKNSSQQILNQMKKSERTYLLINGEKTYFAGRIVIGRCSDCDVVIKNSTVSRHHALIQQSGEFFLLHDLHSKNRTVLNRQVLSPNRYVSLNSGDSIRLGDVTIYFVQDGE